jgi:hypothetical protein
MKWTWNRPTAPGHYWIKRPGEKKPIVTEIEERRGRLETPMGVAISQLPYRWSDEPVPKPEGE